MIAALVLAAGNPPNKCKTNTEHKYNNAHMKNAQMKSAQMQNQRRAQIQQCANEKCKNAKIHQTNAKLAHNTNVHMQNKHKARVICQKSQKTAIAASLLLGSSSNAFGIVILLWHTANSSR